MFALWTWTKGGYLRLVEPVADAFAARRVDPNAITAFGTACAIVSGALFATGWIHLAGWVLGITAVFDVLDGMVARRSGRTTSFGAFIDSTLDRVSDGAILGGLTIFWAIAGPHYSVLMVTVGLAAIVGSFLTSYTRARAEGLGVDAREGWIQRPERIVLLSAPQAFFGLAFDGAILKGIMVVLTLTAWATVWQRVGLVRRAATEGR